MSDPVTTPEQDDGVDIDELLGRKEEEPPPPEEPVLKDEPMVPEKPVPPPSPPPRPRGLGARSTDPLLAFQFSVELTHDPFGLIGFMIPIKGYFTEISGLEVEWETVEFKTTDFIGWPRSQFVPMRPVYKPITLRRGITNDEGFWLWHQLMFLGAKPLLNTYVTITMYDRFYKPVAMWSVEKAWPSKITGPQIKSDSSDFVVEEMTLTHSGIHRSYLAPEFMLLDVAIQMLLP